MGAIASQITSLTIVYSTVYSGADQSKHQSSASLAFLWGIHRGPVNSPHKWPVTRKMFPFDDVIMHYFKQYLVECSTPNHYRNQCGLIANWTKVQTRWIQWQCNHFIYKNEDGNMMSPCVDKQQLYMVIKKCSQSLVTDKISWCTIIRRSYGCKPSRNASYIQFAHKKQPYY